MGQRLRARHPRWRRLLAALTILGAPAVLLGPVRADVVTGDNVAVSFHGRIRPSVLPRQAPAPVSLHVDGSVHPLGEGTPAGLSRVIVQVNRHAVFSVRGLPRCPPRRLRGVGTREALARCREALIGTGFITSHIDYPEQAPFPARGRLLVFNSAKHGHTSLAIHVFGRRPAAITTVLAGALVRRGAATGTFGPRIAIAMPKARAGWGYVNGFGLTFHRRFRYGGKWRSLVSASCPAPEGVNVVPFRSLRGTFELVDGQVLDRALGGHCRAARR